jgi:hypothetical protein
MDIAAANAYRSDFEQDVSLAELGHRDLPQFDAPRRSSEIHHRLHRFHSCSS